MSSKNERSTYLVWLEPLPSVADPIKALRAALKELLRRHELRCVDLIELPPKSRLK